MPLYKADKQNSDLAARVKAMLYVGNNAVSL